jgi:hypothetical protein
MLTVSCPKCSHKMKAADDFVGKKAKCGNCGETFVIQDAPASEVVLEPIESPKASTAFNPTARVETADDTAGLWHCARDGQSIGPVSAVKLREMAVAGILEPGDLVWKQGMENWVPAGQIKGLIERTSPPPIPGSRPPIPGSRPPIPSSTGRPPDLPDKSTASAGLAPPLWNPFAAGITSLFLPWALGALLVALNWRALAEPEQEKRAMRWFYAATAFIAAIPLTNIIATSFPLAVVCYFVVNPILWLIWNFAVCEQQRKLLKRLFGNRYERRGLFVPIALTILITFGWLIFAGAVVGALRSPNEPLPPA